MKYITTYCSLDSQGIMFNYLIREKSTLAFYIPLHIIAERSLELPEPFETEVESPVIKDVFICDKRLSAFASIPSFFFQ